MTGKRVTFADVLRVREFRILWLADAQSSIGDQVGRVALSVLVFERTASALLTALTYALTFLPALVGGALLSSLADQLPRRQVMIASTCLRAVLFALMAVPAMPLWIICGLLIVAVLGEAPFTAAESAMMPAILEGDHYVVGTGLRTITYQIAQLAGFAGGGLAIAAIGARQGLLVDAVTFVLSSLLILFGVRARPAARTADESGDEGFRLASFLTGFRIVFGSPRLRALVGLAWLCGVYVVPEGVAAPYAARISGGAAAVGLLMAAMPTGTALGTYLFVRWVPAGSRSTWMGPLGMASGVPLIFCVFLPGLAGSLALWAASGLFFCYQVQVVTEFVRDVPDAQRGQAVGIASSGMLAVQGVGVLLGGWVASGLGVGWAVAGSGLVGVILALYLSAAWARARRGSGDRLDGDRLIDSARPRHRA
ncbi:MAG TPA: MFS transporter [Jatrophihabitans sp.]|nr:MFS transporter [Jatrophihabitans sp.]